MSPPAMNSPPPTPPASSAGSPTPNARVRVIRLLATHGLSPNTDLGQHFLADENLVDLSLRAARLRPEDVVLEVGAGVGVLTRALAGAVAWVHTVEIDHRLEPVLAVVLAGHHNITIHWEDAIRLAVGELVPVPTAIVSNLPYAIATPVVVESTWRLTAVRVWSVMVQREVADRWLAQPGDPSYGAPSVLIQLAAEPTFRRNVGREVFVPRPRVDSALVVLRRTGPGAAPSLRGLVRAAFAQRRKTIANNLAVHGISRTDVAGVLEELGLPPTARPEHLAPEHYRVLADRLPWPTVS
jgi:16S rRNA (adenine1518-N6/adenine1519-N6)-dimethyltransferase